MQLKHFLQFNDFAHEEFEYLYERTRWIKSEFKQYQRYWPLEDRTLAMIFDKHSTRTRLSFEAGMHQLGGEAIYLSTRDTQLGRGEPVEDAARVISRIPASNDNLVLVECLSKIIAGEVFKPGNHASTFGGNPLACTAAITTLNVIEEEDLMSNAMEQGDFMRKTFQTQLEDVEDVMEIRGQGLMIGIELSKPCGDLVKDALKKKLLINVTLDKVIRLLPSLVLKRSEAEQMVNTVSTLIREF